MRTRAKDKDGNIVYINKAQRGIVYFDDMFDDLEMIPVQGAIKEWHFRYKSGQDRDTWANYENSMSEFHIAQQALFPIEEREVPIYPHRADVLTGGNTVIEIQHSWLSYDSINERSEFYIKNVGALVWVLDASDNVVEKYYDQKSALTVYSLNKKKFISNFLFDRPRQEIFLYVGDNITHEYIHVLRVQGIWDVIYGNKIGLPHFMSYINAVKNRANGIEKAWAEFELKFENIKRTFELQKKAAEELMQRQKKEAEEWKIQQAKEAEELEREKKKKIKQLVEQNAIDSIDAEVASVREEVTKWIIEINQIAGKHFDEWNEFSKIYANVKMSPTYYMKKALDMFIKDRFSA